MVSRVRTLDELRALRRAHGTGALEYASAGAGTMLGRGHALSWRVASAEPDARRPQGHHQFHLPDSTISAGTRTRRMMLASSATANARPSPNSRVGISRVNPNEAKIEIMISAALVMMRAVRPSATAT